MKYLVNNVTLFCLYSVVRPDISADLTLHMVFSSLDQSLQSVYSCDVFFIITSSLVSFIGLAIIFIFFCFIHHWLGNSLFDMGDDWVLFSWIKTNVCNDWNCVWYDGHCCGRKKMYPDGRICHRNRDFCSLSKITWCAMVVPMLWSPFSPLTHNLLC